MKNYNFSMAHISTTCLLRMLLRNLWMIVASALICAMGASLAISWGYQPRYEATMTYAVAARVSSYSSSGNNAATKEVAATLTELLKSNMVMGRVRNYTDELSGFNGSISASRVGETNMIVVEAEADSPKDAFLAMCAVEELFPTIVSYVSSDCVVQVIRNPDVSGTPENDVNEGNVTRVSAVMGALGMAALLCWISAARGTIQTRTGARDLLDAPVIASINRVHRKKKYKDLMKRDDKPLQVFAPTTGFDYTEKINTICAQIELEAAAHGGKIFVVAGVGENEGKSTVAGNVAAALAMMGKRVAVVDCDLRNPSLCRFFGGKYVPSMPLNQMLSEPFSRENLLQCMVRHNQMSLFMLFSQTPDRRCTELLTGRTMQTLLLQLRVFDFVILDTPPMGYFADTEVLLDKVDASLLVVRQNRTPACDINDAIDLLRDSDARFMGCVLNDMTSTLTEGNAYGYGYGYGYGKGYGYGAASGHKHS